MPALQCPNCYLVLGAGFLVVVNYYNAGSILNFEAKMTGAAGFALNARINQRIYYSNSTVIQLIKGADKPSNFNLGYGLSLSSQFSGLNARVSGSINATFNAKFGAGAFASATVGTMYTQNKWKNISQAAWGITPPYFNASVSVNSLALGVTLAATTNFKLKVLLHSFIHSLSPPCVST